MFRRVVVFLVDGLRPDAVTIDRMPSLYELGHAFVRAEFATTVRPSTTVAALTSLATGVPPQRQGLTGARIPAVAPLTRVELLPRLIRRRGLGVSVVAADLPLIRRSIAQALTSVAGVGALRLADPHPGRLAEAAFSALERTPRGLAVVYLPHCDQAGHADGWMSPAYLEAAGRVDKAIGLLVSELERDLVIVLSDHGGGGVDPREHDAVHPFNERIPLVPASDVLPRSTVIGRPVSILDVPVTIAQALSVPVPSSYEGRSLMDLETPLAVGTG